MQCRHGEKVIRLLCNFTTLNVLEISAEMEINMVKSHKKLILSIIFIALIGLIYLIIPRTSAPINSTDTDTIYDISSNISTDASTRHNVNIGDIDNNGTLDSII